MAWTVGTTRKTVISKEWIVPDWPAPPTVRSLLTTRSGGVSRAPYASLNLADHVGDDPLAVAINRQRLSTHLPSPPCWLNQVHGVDVVDAQRAGGLPTPVADAALARVPGVVCGVLTADCLPLLLCDRQGSVVAAVHAGWRGLLAGVVQQTVRAMAIDGDELLAYLGPAIGPQAFVVGDEVRAAFVDSSARAAAAFQPIAEAPAGGGAGSTTGRAMGQAAGWLADIYLLARQALADVGVEATFGGEYCTVHDASRFFSYRRDGATGRMASLIWLAAD